MQRRILLAVLITVGLGWWAQQTTVAQGKAAKNPDAARWDQQARNVTIIRDDWGIAHVYGKTDADAAVGLRRFVFASVWRGGSALRFGRTGRRSGSLESFG